MTPLVAVGAFVAGAFVSLFVQADTAHSKTDVRMVSEQSALLSQSLGNASDATFALLMMNDEEKARRWHLSRLETAIGNAFDSTKHVNGLETPLPHLLASLRKARPLLENNSPSHSLAELAALEQWLETANRAAANERE